MIYKTARVSPNHLTENQIDHICIGKRFRSHDDVRVRRGADVASDHDLLIARLKLKKPWMVTVTNRPKYNVGLLIDPQTREEYKLNLTKSVTCYKRRTRPEQPVAEHQTDTDIALPRNRWPELATTEPLTTAPGAGSRCERKGNQQSVEQEQQRHKHRKNTQQPTER